MQFTKMLKRIANHYGYDAQSRQCIEEMSELAKALNKYWRKQMDYGTKPFSEVPYGVQEETDIIEEIADVQIMLWQMQIFYNTSDKELNGIIDAKLRRQLGRIEEELRMKERNHRMRLREIKPGMVIHCKTEEEAKILLAHLQNQGVIWRNGDSLDEENNWSDYMHDTCYGLENDGLVFCGKNYYEKNNIDIIEFSDLIIPELTPAEVPAILYEICKEYSKNRESCSPVCPFAFNGMKCDQYKAENGQRVVEVCEQWKAEQEKKESEKKEPEVEWFWQGRIYKIHDNDKGNFFQLKDGNGFYDTGCQYREGAEEYMEEVLKEYCKEHEGNYIAVVEHVCRVKR